ALALFPYPHYVAAAAAAALRRRQHCTPSTWANAPTAGAAALERHLTGGRCHLPRALLLQELPPLQATALATAGLAVGGRPSMGVGRGWPALHGGWPWVASPAWGLAVASYPSLLPSLRKCIERFYAIQSHHTHFKTNLSHENLDSDITVGKPQWVYHIRSGNQNKNWFPT
ncbi:hypothetical protein GW17_00056163, partial [Ensete ventricosum]